MKEDTDNGGATPQESTAATQGNTAFEAAPPQGASAYTRALYRKLQAVLDSGNDSEAFSLLQKILAEVPDDRAAARLAREVGQRLYLSYADELEAVVKRGQAGQIASLVATLRLMASDSQLEALPGFREAVGLVEAEERRKLAISLHAGICRLREAGDLKTREQLALGIEQFAAQKNLTMSAEQQALVTAAHEEWNHFCQLEQLRRALEDQRDVFREWERKARHNEDLELCAQQLDDCHKAVLALRALSESADLLERVDRCRREVKSTLQARRRRRAMVRSAVVAVSLIVILSIAALAYSFVYASKLKDRLAAARAARDVAAVRSLAEDSSLIRCLSLGVSPSCADELKSAESWLAGYKACKDKLDTLAPKLIAEAGRLEAQNVTAEQMVDGLALQREVELVSQKLRDVYNEQPTAELERNLVIFPDRLHLIREDVLNRFRNPADCADMASLYELYQKCQKCCEPLNVTKEEQSQIHAGFMAAAARLLSMPGAENGKPFRSAAAAEAAVRDFKKYRPLMELNDDLLLQLTEEARQAACYEALPQTLAKAGSFSEYVAALQNCKACYDKLEGVVPLAGLQAIAGKETDCLLRYKLEEYYRSAGEGQGDATPLSKEQLGLTLDIYSGKQSLYAPEGKPSPVMAAAIADVLDSPSTFWPAGLHSLHKGKYLYLGRLSADKKKLTIAGNGSSSGKTETVSAASTVHEIDLAGAREALGFGRESLMGGKVTPARLMHNVATASPEQYPGKVRAYLFLAAVKMLDKLEPHVSGKVFSPSLQADAEEFRALCGKGKNPGTPLPRYWFDYPYSDEEIWNAFFAKAATHDYEKEILGAVQPIVGVSCEFAGYVDEAGRVVRLRSGNEPLLLIVNGEMAPMDADAKVPAYTPLFLPGIAR